MSATDTVAQPLPPSAAVQTVVLDAAEHRWQERLLPLMMRMLVGLTIFFFAATLVQLVYLNRVIERVPPTDYARLGIAPLTATEAVASAEFRILASLDANLLERRYHQANVLLMGRLWTSYLGFVTGMILALVGAVFILGKLKTDPSDLGASGGGASLNLRSTSPGLVLAALGVVLMVSTIVTHHPITTAESAVYVDAYDAKPVLPQESSATPPSGTQPASSRQAPANFP